MPSRDDLVILGSLVLLTAVIALALFLRRGALGASSLGNGELTSVAQSVAVRNARRSDLLTDQRRPLTRSTCFDHAVPCVEDRNCELLCSDFALVPSTCIANLCTTKDNEGGEGGGEEPGGDCDTKKGEYAFLRGVTEIGTAEWACINLFPDWQPSAERSFCEGGEWSMNANERNPSWRDCRCPDTHLRVVYKLPNGEDGDGKPHCVARERFREYRSAYEEVAATVRAKE